MFKNEVPCSVLSSQCAPAPSSFQTFHANEFFLLCTVICGERVSQMTKTYNDVEAVTRLLDEVTSLFILTMRSPEIKQAGLILRQFSFRLSNKHASSPFPCSKLCSLELITNSHSTLNAFIDLDIAYQQYGKRYRREIAHWRVLCHISRLPSRLNADA